MSLMKALRGAAYGSRVVRDKGVQLHAPRGYYWGHHHGMFWHWSEPDRVLIGIIPKIVQWGKIIRHDLET